MNFVDTHCHLDFYEDFESVIENSKMGGVTRLISVGTSISGSKKSIEIAEKYSEGGFKIYATCGIHAEEGRGDLKHFGPDYVNKLGLIAQSSKKVVAIGECGFDFRTSPDQIPDEEKKFQQELFEAQIRLAKDLDLPLIIHCRNGWEETFSIIENLKLKIENLKGVFHSWTGDWKLAKKALDWGFYISFSGIVTYKQSLRSSSLNKFGTTGLKNAKEVQEVARLAPLDRILIETDSPFLVPEPLRSSTSPSLPAGKAGLRGASKQNEPKNVKIIAQFIADLRGVSSSEIASKTFENACNLFKLR